MKENPQILIKMNSPIRAIKDPVLSSKSMFMKSQNWSFTALLIAAKY